MLGGKYIRGPFGDMVIWTGGQSHKEMAANVGYDVNLIPSAGMIKDNGGGLQCFGESLSLGKKSDPKDTEYLRHIMEMDV